MNAGQAGRTLGRGAGSASTRATFSGGMRSGRDPLCYPLVPDAEVADAPDLGSAGETLGGSTPPFRTIPLIRCPKSSSL